MTNTHKIHPTSIIEGDVTLGTNSVIDSRVLLQGPIRTGTQCYIGNGCCLHGPVEIGDRVFISDMVLIGHPIQKKIIAYQEGKSKSPYNDSDKTTIGNKCIIRTGTTIYAGSQLGSKVWVGHSALIREKVTVGNNSLVGSSVIIDGNCSIGPNVRIQSGVYIPTNTIIEDHVFLGPKCILTNDKYLTRTKYELKGPTIKRGASIGAGAVILPGIEIGKEAVVGAGAVVTKNVPSRTIVVGVPSQIQSTVPNSWKFPSQ